MIKEYGSERIIKSCWSHLLESERRPDIPPSSADIKAYNKVRGAFQYRFAKTLSETENLVSYLSCLAHEEGTKLLKAEIPVQSSLCYAQKFSLKSSVPEGEPAYLAGIVRALGFNRGCQPSLNISVQDAADYMIAADCGYRGIYLFHRMMSRSGRLPFSANDLMREYQNRKFRLPASVKIRGGFQMSPSLLLHLFSANPFYAPVLELDRPVVLVLTEDAFKHNNNCSNTLLSLRFANVRSRNAYSPHLLLLCQMYTNETNASSGFDSQLTHNFKVFFEDLQRIIDFERKVISLPHRPNLLTLKDLNRFSDTPASMGFNGLESLDGLNMREHPVVLFFLCDHIGHLGVLQQRGLNSLKGGGWNLWIKESYKNATEQRNEQKKHVMDCKRPVEGIKIARVLTLSHIIVS